MFKALFNLVFNLFKQVVTTLEKILIPILAVFSLFYFVLNTSGLALFFTMLFLAPCVALCYFLYVHEPQMSKEQ